MMILHKYLQFLIIGDELTRLDFSRCVLQMLQNNLHVYYFAISHTSDFTQLQKYHRKEYKISQYHNSKTRRDVTYSSNVSSSVDMLVLYSTQELLSF